MLQKNNRGIENLIKHLYHCTLCPRRCGVNRMENQKGYCGVGKLPIVSSWGLHFGEERPISGKYGSGTIFFSGCNLKCVFCQNYDISHNINGIEVNSEDLEKIIFDLISRGAHNINFVTPTHVAAQISQTVFSIKSQVRIPFIYNCSGYEEVYVIEKLEGLIDIYMPDIKFFDKEASSIYLNAEDYPEVVKEVVKKMYEQVGEPVLEKGILKRGVLIRHLVIPDYYNDSKEIISWIADTFRKNVLVNIMDQYTPYFNAHLYPKINKRISIKEYLKIREFALKLGLLLID